MEKKFPIISLFGFISIIVAVRCKSKYAFQIFSVYICISTTASLFILFIFCISKEKILSKIQKNAQSLWFINGVLYQMWVKDFQSKFSCCGWFNVFDYCDVPSVTHIVYQSINQGELKETLKNIEEMLCAIDLEQCQGSRNH